MFEAQLKMLDLCYFEVTEAFKGLSDENVWRRPAPRLLSVGELAGHVAYWEAVRFCGESPDGGSSRDLSDCKLKSPLLADGFGYYTETLGTLPSGEHLKMKAQEVLEELQRIHSEAMACLKAFDPGEENKPPHWHSDYGDLLNYVAFHIAYHTGQMYSVRHLLGESTPDN